MKDIDRVNILDVLNSKIPSDIMEKCSVEKPIFRGGDIIISPPVLIGLKEPHFGVKKAFKYALFKMKIIVASSL